MLFDSTRPLQRLSASSELGGHAAGTGVRALALVPLDGSHGSFRLTSVNSHCNLELEGEEPLYVMCDILLKLVSMWMYYFQVQ